MRKKKGGMRRVLGTSSINSEAHFKTATANSIFLHVQQRTMREIKNTTKQPYPKTFKRVVGMLLKAGAKFWNPWLLTSAKQTKPTPKRATKYKMIIPQVTTPVQNLIKNK